MADFSEPRLAINRVYTRQGDLGETALAGGQRLSKSDLRIEAYGTVDELNAFVGMARQSAEEGNLTDIGEPLLRIQHELFNLGSQLSTLPTDLHPKQARITDAESQALEAEMDRMNAGLEPLRSFVLPGGSRLNAELHVCRTVCRRAERICVALAARESTADPAIVRYLNRLSDAFFVMSRRAAHHAGTETLWNPNHRRSEQS